MEHATINTLIPAASWPRIQTRVQQLPQITPVLFADDGTLKFPNGERAECDLHIAWHSFEVPRQQVGAFAQVLLTSDSLRFVQTAASGLDAPFFAKLAQAHEQRLTLCNSDAQANAIAEYVLASVLNVMHDFPGRKSLQDNKRWQPQPFQELAGSHCLVLGHGNIGARIVSRLQAFDATVSVIRSRSIPVAGAYRTGQLSDLPNFLADADVVILAAALNHQTDQLLDASMLAQCKPGCTLVNIARGAMIDERALLAALDTGAVGHAVLDVFATEPLPKDHPFWAHERVLVSAHTSNNGSGRRQRGDDLFIENLHNFLEQQPLRNLVDVKRLAAGEL